MTTTMMTLSGSSIAAPAQYRLSLSSAFGSTSEVQQLGIVRASAKPSKVVAARASSNNDQRFASTRPKIQFQEATDAGSAGCSRSSVGTECSFTVASPSGLPWKRRHRTKVGENSSVRGAASSGTPLGEGSKSGSGVETAKDAVDAGIDVNIDPLKTKIGDISPLKSTLNPEAPASDAKSSPLDVIGDVKSKLFGGN